MVRSLLYLLLFCSASFACVPPDCDNEDSGTCANACCTLEFMFSLSPDEVNTAMVQSLKAGGPDQRYTLVSDDDYRPYNMTVKWMLQTIHATKVHHYNDTQDWTVSVEGKEPNPHNPKRTVVKGFSISQIHGAYGDAGQNYKNLVGFVKGLNVKFEQKAVSGCPPPKHSLHN